MCSHQLLPRLEPRLCFVQHRIALLFASLCVGCDGTALYLYGVLWPVSCLWLAFCMLFWELCLHFVQCQIVLLPDAPNGVVSIGVVRLLPRIVGHDGVGCHACSIARLTTAVLTTDVHVHWPAFDFGFGLNVPARFWAESCSPCIALTWCTSFPL
ncbi:hypothetical protein V6N11_004987 [Hibiscus sabdariffa]|uniref:Uncharacterized protein n=2 Tax=Hibiscus sabdariffa TaxID=183260 RepID=A0ABR1ZZS9_9ROSI